jgi:hypothetical protein
MAYTITKTNGAIITTVTDGTVDVSATSLTLIGKNYAGYGIFLNENYVKLLENFANGTPPTTPLAGQLWFDTTFRVIRFYDSTSSQWKSIGSTTTAASAPANPITGDLWWDSTNSQLKAWSGAAWTLIGPSYTASSGQSGALVETIVDTSAASHVVIKFYIQNLPMAIVSKDATFTPQTALPGFTSIKPGFNLISSGTVASAAFYGDVSNALAIGGLTSDKLLRNDVSGTINGTLTINNNSGLIVGGGSNFTVAVNPGTSAVNLTNVTTSADINLYVSPSGVLTKSLTVVGASGQISLPVNIDSTSTTTGALTVLGGVGVGGNIYAGGKVYATATSAQYSDLAERFEADASYTPGTVLEIGGEKEVTLTTSELSENVFGVVSTAPAYLMNNEAGENDTHPAIALSGRVPVRVVGKVNKGDRLVSAGNGCARAALSTEITPFNVIGRSLEEKVTDDEALILVVVKSIS